MLHTLTPGTFQVKKDKSESTAECDRRFIYDKFQVREKEVFVDGVPTMRKYTAATLVMADKEMLQNACTHGHGKPLFMDTTFAMSKYQGSFLTVLAVDDSNRGIPICWAFVPDEKAETITAVLKALAEAVRKIKPDFQPSCFFTDDCEAEQIAVRCEPCNVFNPSPASRHRVFANASSV